MDVDPILKSAPEDEAIESLRKINELLFLIASGMNPAGPAKEEAGK